MVRVLRDGPSVGSAPQTALITRDGRDVLIADSGAPIWSEEGTLHGLVLVFRDISVRRHLEDQLRQAQKMQALGTLAGGVAHDFNNILMMILGYTELAQDDLPLDSPIRVHLQHVLTAGRRAAALVRQILTFSRQTPVEWTPVSLTALLREILPFVQTLLPATIALEAHLPPEPCPVLANTTQMFQLVMNLGANAEYAMRATGGRLAVRLEPVEVDAALAATHPAFASAPRSGSASTIPGRASPRTCWRGFTNRFSPRKRWGTARGWGCRWSMGLSRTMAGPSSWRVRWVRARPSRSISPGLSSRT